MVHHYETIIGGRTLSMETGQLAEQADGAVLTRYGDTMVLATAVATDTPREGVDFLPLTVDYEERLYAAGKIPGAFQRREGRPSENAILTCRLTDRPLRPLFPKGFRNDVQIIITALSSDQENEPDILTIVAASAATSISDVPFYGPVGAVRIGYIDGQFVVNPLASQMAQSRLDLKVAGTREAIMMVECSADALPEDLMLEALEFAHREMQPIIDLQEKMMAEVGKPKRAYTVIQPSEAARQAVKAFLADKLASALNQEDKTERERLLDELQASLVAQFQGTYPEADVQAVFDEAMKHEVRSNILLKSLRPDGRDLTTIRPISCAVGLLPRTHGSGLFTRGQTQVLTIATLGSVADEQKLDTLSLLERKRYMHHYNMPPFATGEARPLRGPGRREIGHGALAERAILTIIPDEETFPYTIRLVSEVLSSNGSTSMAAVCGSTLALMDAGVPIKAPVGGVAMGLVMGDDGRYAVLTDIQGIEDALGDMDFKVAGTADGITALQMDIKIKGITTPIMQKALAQAREGRLFILRQMLNAIDKARPELSPFAPRIVRLKINPEKIGTVIGPGGKMIRSIQEEFKVDIEVEDDGTVTIATEPGGDGDKAAERIRALTENVEVGKIYMAKVVRLESFGVFVEVLPGKDALVRLGDLAEYRVNRPEDAVKMGDEIMVMVTEIDSQGRVNASRRAVLEGAPLGRATVTSERRPPRRTEPYRGGPPRRSPDGERPERPAPRPPRPSPGGPERPPRSPEQPQHPFGKKW
jgi:polyribonucleotide nucleotidyltransferase